MQNAGTGTARGNVCEQVKVCMRRDMGTSQWLVGKSVSIAEANGRPSRDVLRVASALKNPSPAGKNH
jgi:hypothetical protein